MPEVTNWRQEEKQPNGQFIAKSNQPASLEWWIKEVKRARQLTLNEQQIKTILMADNNIPKNKENALFSQMKVGNQKLYLDVTSKVNGLVERAVYTTKTQLVNEVFLTQILNDIASSIRYSETITKLFKDPTPYLVNTLANNFITNGIHSLILYTSSWKHYVKNNGTWDYKRKLDPFKSGARSDMSPFFWYNGYQGKQYKLFPYHKAGLLRFDDPGNMCYAVSGKILMSHFHNTLEKFTLLMAAEAFAALNSQNRKEFGQIEYTQLKNGPTAKWFDDPWDLTAIEWAYDTPFVQSDEFVPFKTFEFYCKRFNLAPNN